MTESFLILLAGGVMLAGSISKPSDVTVHWLRLGGIIALAMAAMAGFFLVRDVGFTAPTYLLIATIVLILAQLAFVQTLSMRAQRIAGLLATVAAIATGVMSLPIGAEAMRWQTATLSAIGAASTLGLVLMTMLLGHAYLTASRMTMRPFGRLNNSLALATLLRAGVAVGVTLAINAAHPVHLLWGAYGLLIGTRWFVGLIVPGIFIYMVHDCIKRKSNQSATGILYVAGVLVFIGEICALNLARATNLPF